MADNIIQSYNLYKYYGMYEFQSLLDIEQAVINAIVLRRQYPNFSFELQVSGGKRKDAQEFAEYQNQEPFVLRDSSQDRVFPLDTVAIQSYRLRHEADIDEATIHYGPGSDELVRSYHAFAITIGTDIFFRNNAYQPESEEGQKLLAHEMTHVAQYQEGRITGNRDEEELETEAELAEADKAYDPDPKVVIVAGGKKHWVRKSIRKEFIQLAADGIERYVKEQKDRMGGKEYLKFLCNYEALLKEKSCGI
jgi:hypothetical protein